MTKISEKELKENGVDSHKVKIDFGLEKVSRYNFYDSKESTPEILVNKYYFEFALYFEKDYDVSKLENILDIKPSKIVKLNESKGDIKTAKFIFRTEELDNIYTDDEFKNFVFLYKDKLSALSSIIEENKGRLAFYIVFTQIQDNPVINLDKDTIHIISDLNADFEIDYS